MREFRRVLRTFEDADIDLAHQWRAAVDRDARLAAARMKSRQEINAKAYFVLLWAQLEDGVTVRCDALLKRKATTSRHRDRRPWAVLAARGGRLSTLEKLALLTDASGPVYARLPHYYRLRNEAPIAACRRRRSICDSSLPISRKISVPCADGQVSCLISVASI